MSKKLTNNEFITKAIAIHGDKYDYSAVNYNSNKEKVEIKCSLHGVFLQKPNDHLCGHGCSKCKEVAPLSTEEFVLRSKKIHGSKYNYSKVQYKGTFTHVIITCKVHGDFLQKPNYHLSGNGCRKCAYEKNLNKNYSQSKSEIDFLDHQCVPNRTQYICGYYVDGYNPQTNTIYEFLGDYWHGNPKIFQTNDINKSLNQSFNKLYQKTFERFSFLKTLGYKIKFMWESDWKNFKRGIDKEPKILEYV